MTQDIDRMVIKAVASFRRLDVLVNNPGVTRRAHSMDLTAEDWDPHFRERRLGLGLLQPITRRQALIDAVAAFFEQACDARFALSP
jgi:short-subunit dehydrogenase involved in D-alanine esterification of teichoic acids